MSDSAWGDDLDTRRSTSGYVYMLGNGAIDWSSKLQPTVTPSTAEAEFMGLTFAGQQGVWLQQVLDDVEGRTETESITPVTLMGDNQASLIMAKEERLKMSRRTRHIEMKYQWIKDEVEKGRIKLDYLNTEDMTADIMTKAISRVRFEKLRTLLGVLLLVSISINHSAATAYNTGNFKRTLMAIFLMVLVCQASANKTTNSKDNEMDTETQIYLRSLHLSASSNQQGWYNSYTKNPPTTDPPMNPPMIETMKTMATHLSVSFSDSAIMDSGPELATRNVNQQSLKRNKRGFFSCDGALPRQILQECTCGNCG